MNVAVLGASPKVERYSNQAIRLLQKFGHTPLPVVPGHQEIEGLRVVPSLADLDPGSVHTVTVYVNAARSEAIQDQFYALRPERVIFNPGAENPKLATGLREAGVDVEEACTLVLLNTGQFDTHRT